MKKLIMINGTMGIGKTTTCNELLKILKPSVFLDGDWCWNMNPFVVTEETKNLVMSNITHMLRNFLGCSIYENVIFCWVMHKESIINDVIDTLYDLEFELYIFTLTATEDALRKRLANDINNKIRTNDVIERSFERVNLYKNIKSIKIDVSLITPKQAAQNIVDICGADI
ncbi:MAG: AAA family ATPase [Vallitalea sp.]|nr:AAA family ATPase [Vallitalea sp.]